MQSEWAYWQIFLNNAERAAALAPWLDFHNTRRRHSAIGGLPPISRGHEPIRRVQQLYPAGTLVTDWVL